MTIYRTCQGCALQRKPCEARDLFREEIKGLGITSVKWSCGERVDRFAIGDPIWLETVYDQNGNSDEDGIPKDFYPGHVIRNLGAKVLVFVKPGSLGRGDYGDDPLGFVGRHNGFCKVSLSRVTPRDGEREQVCPSCEWPSSLGHIEGYRCHREAAER